MSIDSVLIIAGLAAFLIFHYFFRSNNKSEEQIWKLISKARICRQAGIDEKDFKIGVTSYVEVDASKSRLPAQHQYNFRVSCKLPKADGKKKWIRIGDQYGVNLTSDAELTEQTIAQDIERTRDELAAPGQSSKP